MKMTSVCFCGLGGCSGKHPGALWETGLKPEASCSCSFWCLNAGTYQVKEEAAWHVPWLRDTPWVELGARHCHNPRK